MSSSDFTSKFQPYRFSDKAVAIHELQREMMDKGAEVFALYFDSVAGQELLTRHLEEWKQEKLQALDKAGMALDKDIWESLASFPVPAPHGHESQFAEFTRSLEDYEKRILPEGRNSLLIGNYLLIALYQYWEDSWRVRIAKALQLADKNLVLSDFWGDLRLIRICLIHKRGIADSELAKKAVLFKWFNEGDAIAVDRTKTQEIISAFFSFLYGELLQYEAKLCPIPPAGDDEKKSSAS